MLVWLAWPPRARGRKRTMTEMAIVAVTTHAMISAICTVTVRSIRCMLMSGVAVSTIWPPGEALAVTGNAVHDSVDSGAAGAAAVFAPDWYTPLTRRNGWCVRWISVRIG